MNLFKETVEVLEKNGKTINDIIAVQCHDFRIEVENFIEVAKKTNYNNGYGHQEVACDLVIIGNGWWMERSEYDGAEWWAFKKAPTILNNVQKVDELAGYGYMPLGKW